MGGCRNVTATFLTVVNVLLFLFGLVIISVGAYLAATLKNAADDVGLGTPVIVSLVLGVFLVLLAVLGCMAVAWDNKCLIFVYIVGVLIVAVAVMASGIVLLVFSGEFKDVDNGSNADKINDNVQEKILTFELAVFNECCATKFGIPDVENCDVLIQTQDRCFNDQALFDDLSAAIDADTCKLLEKVDIDDHPLVGDVTDRGCGFGVASVFVKDMNDYANSNLSGLGIANISAGVIILVMLIAACVLLWTDDKKQRS